MQWVKGVHCNMVDSFQMHHGYGPRPMTGRQSSGGQVPSLADKEDVVWSQRRRNVGDEVTAALEHARRQREDDQRRIDVERNVSASGNVRHADSHPTERADDKVSRVAMCTILTGVLWEWKVDGAVLCVS